MARKSGFWKRTIESMVPAVVPLVLRLFGLTWSVRLLNRPVFEKYVRGPDSFVGVLWHQDIIPALWVCRNSGIMVMISRSRDGDMVARVARRMGLRTVRGSSSKGGEQALREIIDDVRRGGKSTIVADGPRGPAKDPKIGAVLAAKRSGRPILLFGCWVEGGLVAGNWDRTRIPLPFARIRVHLGGPIPVDPDASVTDCAEERRRIRDAAETAQEMARRG